MASVRHDISMAGVRPSHQTSKILQRLTFLSRARNIPLHSVSWELRPSAPADYPCDSLSLSAIDGARPHLPTSILLVVACRRPPLHFKPLQSTKPGRPKCLWERLGSVLLRCLLPPPLRELGNMTTPRCFGIVSALVVPASRSIHFGLRASSSWGSRL